MHVNGYSKSLRVRTGRFKTLLAEIPIFIPQNMRTCLAKQNWLGSYTWVRGYFQKAFLTKYNFRDFIEYIIV